MHDHIRRDISFFYHFSNVKLPYLGIAIPVWGTLAYTRFAKCYLRGQTNREFAALYLRKYAWFTYCPYYIVYLFVAFFYTGQLIGLATRGPDNFPFFFFSFPDQFGVIGEWFWFTLGCLITSFCLLFIYQPVLTRFFHKKAWQWYLTFLVSKYQLKINAYDCMPVTYLFNPQKTLHLITNAITSTDTYSFLNQDAKYHFDRWLYKRYPIDIPPPIATNTNPFTSTQTYQMHGNRFYAYQNMQQAAQTNAPVLPHSFFRNKLFLFSNTFYFAYLAFLQAAQLYPVTKKYFACWAWLMHIKTLLYIGSISALYMSYLVSAYIIDPLDVQAAPLVYQVLWNIVSGRNAFGWVNLTYIGPVLFTFLLDGLVGYWYRSIVQKRFCQSTAVNQV